MRWNIYERKLIFDFLCVLFVRAWGVLSASGDFNIFIEFCDGIEHFNQELSMHLAYSEHSYDPSIFLRFVVDQRSRTLYREKVCGA